MRKTIFRRNVGGIDRAVRLALGVVMLPAGLFLLSRGYSHALTITIVGFAALATGIAGFCGLYIPLGISTVPKGVRETRSSASPQESRLRGRTAGDSSL